jgi:hypothetical protein
VGQGLNIAEVDTVVSLILDHASERPHESLGVGTFNMRQQMAILDELELRRREDPSIEPFFARGGAEPFFVKNLENIQGDERDVIFLSVTYAKSPDGRLRYNFGPINGENGWRRLNVLTTRARRRMRVFSSCGRRDQRRRRDVARSIVAARLPASPSWDGWRASSPTPRRRWSAVRAAGGSELIARCREVGIAGYRIDIGVLDDDVPGRFVCGIGATAWRMRAETARDRDRLQQGCSGK